MRAWPARADVVDILAIVGLVAVTAVIMAGFAWRYRAPAGRTTGRVAWVFSTPGRARTLLFLVFTALTATVTWIGWVSLPLPGLSSAVDTSLRLVGTVVYLAGVVLIVWGRTALGRVWTVATGLGVRLHEDHRLIQHGPFTLVRHPMYVGFWLLLVGALLIYRTWILVVYLVIALASFSRRAHVEEKALAEAFGKEWRDYANRVGRWFPHR